MIEVALKFYTRKEKTPEVKGWADSFGNAQVSKFLVYDGVLMRFAKYRDGKFVHWTNNKPVLGVLQWAYCPESVGTDD